MVCSAPLGKLDPVDLSVVGTVRELDRCLRSLSLSEISMLEECLAALCGRVGIMTARMGLAVFKQTSAQPLQISLSRCAWSTRLYCLSFVSPCTCGVDRMPVSWACFQ